VRVVPVKSDPRSHQSKETVKIMSESELRNAVWAVLNTPNTSADEMVLALRGYLRKPLPGVPQEFRMVEAATANGLQEGVNQLLDQGWRLHGVTMMATELGGLGTAGVTCRFVQALVREAGEEG
jgi:hypothetical protein